MPPDAHADAQARLAAFTGYLSADPGNLALRVDAADAALDAGAPDRALALVRDYADPRLVHRAGLALLQLGRHEEAVHRFEALRQAGEDAPALRYNLAYALSLGKRWEPALDALGPSAADALPPAAALEVGLLHQLGRLDDAAVRARALLARHPDHRALNAAASVLALDLGDEVLAEACAARAGAHPDALTTAATLALDRGDSAAAAAGFEQALTSDPARARAWLGRGLTRLVAGDAALAAPDLDRGAELFDTHLGSWIAAGWAHLLAGAPETARARFDRAMAIDDTFAEAHGSRAVVDLIEGRVSQAKRGVQVAQRLDRACFSAALATMLLAAAHGDPARAKLVLDRALTTPIDGSGRTIAAMLVRLGRVTGR